MLVVSEERPLAYVTISATSILLLLRMSCSHDPTRPARDRLAKAGAWTVWPQLADLLDRMDQLESSIDEMGWRQNRQSSDLQKIDQRLTDHTGLRPRKNPHG
jgi:hypothetical protein